MSSRRNKNNHYHYAEKFEDRKSRSAKSRKAYFPFKSVIISLVVLLMFGLTCTTFSVYVTESTPADDPDHPSILMQARNMKASRDIALTGAEANITSSGAAGWMDMKGGGVFIFDNTNTGWSSVQLVVGRRYSYGGAGVYCRVQSMTKITGTNLYSATIDNWATSGDDIKIYDVRFTTGSNYNTGNFSPTDSGFLASCTHYTGVFSSSGYTFNKGDLYHCYASSSSDGATLNVHYREDGYSYFNHDQLIRSYTKDASHTTYSQVNDGGTITGSSYELSGNAASTATTEGSGEVVAALTATVTLTANPASGYRFVEWKNGSGTSLSNGVGGYTISYNSSTGKSTISYTCTGDIEIRAYFIKTYTVTVQNMSGYTGTAPTGSGTYDIGQTVTIGATTPTGVNFTGWTISGSYSGGSTSSASTTITPSSNITATASYSLKAPKNLNLTYDAYKVVGYSSYAPTSTPSAQSQTANGSGSVLSYAFSIAKHSSNTLAGAGTFSVDSSGAVTASVPGKYVVTMTVTDTCYGLTSTASTTATVEVKPESQSFSYSVVGYSGSIAEGITGESAAYPYQIPISRNGQSDFSISCGLTGNASYSYNWTTTDSEGHTATYSTTNASANGNRITDVVEDPETVLHAATVRANPYTYTVSVVVSYNGVESVAATKTLYYVVTNEFLTEKHFNFDNADTASDETSVQKIYAIDNDISQIYAAYDAGGNNFDTILYFSVDNRNYTPIQIFTSIPFTLNGKTYPAQPNDVSHQTNQPYTLDSTTNYLIFNLPVLAQLANSGAPISDIINVMQRSGVKYFKGYVYDYDHVQLGASEPRLHTTVGTSSAAGARPIYFKDSNTYTDTRLMAYFQNSSGEVTYQTAEDYNDVVTQIDSNRTDRTGIYRFYAPSDAVSVTFAYTSTDAYVLPAENSGTLNFTPDSTLFPAMTATVSLDSDYNMYKITSRTADPNNGIYDYTGEWTKLDMDS